MASARGKCSLVADSLWDAQVSTQRPCLGCTALHTLLYLSCGKCEAPPSGFPPSRAGSSCPPVTLPLPVGGNVVLPLGHLKTPCDQAQPSQGGSSFHRPVTSQGGLPAFPLRRFGLLPQPCPHSLSDSIPYFFLGPHAVTGKAKPTVSPHHHLLIQCPSGSPWWAEWWLEGLWLLMAGVSLLQLSFPL